MNSIDFGPKLDFLRIRTKQENAYDELVVWLMNLPEYEGEDKLSVQMKLRFGSYDLALIELYLKEKGIKFWVIEKAFFFEGFRARWGKGYSSNGLARIAAIHAGFEQREQTMMG